MTDLERYARDELEVTGTEDLVASFIACLKERGFEVVVMTGREYPGTIGNGQVDLRMRSTVGPERVKLWTARCTEGV